MNYPIGIQNFEKIREDGFVYVDKTDLIYELANSGKYFFLSRPRRFGKSLLLSTVEAYFEGRKELFKGLKIEKLENDWTVYPIIHIDLNIGYYNSSESLHNFLLTSLSKYEDIYGSNPHEITAADKFSGIIYRAFQRTGRRVVVLIDEYDKPLIETISDKKLSETMRDMLRPFYGVLKTQDKYIKLALLTGITKFGRLNIFSELNNLTDITFTPKFATICGITEPELTTYFENSINELAGDNGISAEKAIEKLRATYDGYRFTKAKKLVYNPYSVLNAFYQGRIEPYWFETGTPKYLVDLLQSASYDISKLEGTIATEKRLSAFNPDSFDPIPIIYQSGYLTIKDYDAENQDYLLDFPNTEVRHGFMEYLLPYFVDSPKDLSRFDIRLFMREVRSGKAEEFMLRLKSFTASISYKILANSENDFHNLLYVIFTIVSLKPIVEYNTSDGRIDMVVETDRYVYVMEFKIDSTASEALEQIDAKSYALPWASDKRQVIKIGANFSTEKRRITDYIITPS